MGLVGFGQPDDGVIQMAYVVPDVRAAMSAWVEKVKVGPWFLLEHFTGNDPKYRGRDSTADVAIAMSFAGHMNRGGAGFSDTGISNGMDAPAWRGIKCAKVEVSSDHLNQQERPR